MEKFHFLSAITNSINTLLQPIMLTDFILALSLAADAFIVSLALSLNQQRLPRWSALSIPLCFGGFQALMPWVGWKIGEAFYTVIAAIDHWIAFGLLLFIGVQMIRSAKKNQDNTSAPPNVTTRGILTLGVATSIDALAVGFTLPTISIQPANSIIMIGVTTTLVCWFAFIATRWLPKSLGHYAEVTAGFVLIALGCKILVSYLLA